MVQAFTPGENHAGKGAENGKKAGIATVPVAANEAEKIFEAKSGGPQVERARGAGLPWRDVMMLAKKCRIIAILTQNLSNACGALWNFRQIPRKARGDINDIA